MKIIYTLLFVVGLTQPNRANAQDYQLYHTQINQAEKYISEAQFQKALEVYLDVFENYDFVFLRDYQVAAQVALHLGDKATAFELIEKGIAAGWTLKQIRKNDYLAPLQKDPEWAALAEAYPTLRQKYLDRIDLATREQVHEMFMRDQKKALGAFIRIGEKAQDRYARRKFAPHSVQQLQMLQEILTEKGYPGEQLIGNNYWMSTILSHHNSISSDYAQQDTLYPALRPKLIEALRAGQISPYEYALMDDWYLTVRYDRTQTGYGFLKPPQSSTLAETNRLRQEVGLRSVALRNQLVGIEQRTGMDFYLPDWIKGKIIVEE